MSKTNVILISIEQLLKYRNRTKLRAYQTINYQPTRLPNFPSVYLKTVETPPPQPTWSRIRPERRENETRTPEVKYLPSKEKETRKREGREKEEVAPSFLRGGIELRTLTPQQRRNSVQGSSRRRMHQQALTACGVNSPSGDLELPSKPLAGVRTPASPSSFLKVRMPVTDSDLLSVFAF